MTEIKFRSSIEVAQAAALAAAHEAGHREAERLAHEVPQDAAPTEAQMAQVDEALKKAVDEVLRQLGWTERSLAQAMAERQIAHWRAQADDLEAKVAADRADKLDEPMSLFGVAVAPVPHEHQHHHGHRYHEVPEASADDRYPGFYL